MDNEIIVRELEYGEELLWSGKPERRLFARGDALRISASLILAGVFGYYWFAKGMTKIGLVMAAGVFLALTLVIYNTVVKLVIKIIQMGRTYYGLSDRRVIFVMLDKNGVRKRMAEIGLSGLNAEHLEMWKEDIGSIVFSDKPTVDAKPLRGGSNWVSYPHYVAPVFFEIRGAKQVYSLYKSSRKTAVRADGGKKEEAFQKYDM